MDEPLRVFSDKITTSSPPLLCGAPSILRDIIMHGCDELMVAYLLLRCSTYLGWDQFQHCILLLPFQLQTAPRLAWMVVCDITKEEGWLSLIIFGHAFCRPRLETPIHLCLSDIRRRLRLHRLGQTIRGRTKGAPNE